MRGTRTRAREIEELGFGRLTRAGAGKSIWILGGACVCNTRRTGKSGSYMECKLMYIAIFLISYSGLCQELEISSWSFAFAEYDDIKMDLRAVGKR